MMPTRAYLKVASVAVQTFLRTVAQVVGSEVIDDVVAFFRAFEGMEAGFRDRAARGARRCSPHPATGVRARHLAAARRDGGGAVLRRSELERNGQTIDALDREPGAPEFGDEAPERAARRGRSWPRRRRRRRRRSRRALREPRRLPGDRAARTRATSRAARASRRRRRSAYVPYLARDVYDFAALREIGISSRRARFRRRPLPTRFPSEAWAQCSS